VGDGSEWNNYLLDSDTCKGWVLEEDYRPLSDYKDENMWHVIEKPACAWNGKGYPPAGQDCEWRLRNQPWNGQLCTPVHFAEDLDRAWLKFHDRSCNGLYVLSAYEFRPAGVYEMDMARREAIDTAFASLTQFRDAEQVLGDLYDSGLLKSIALGD